MQPASGGAHTQWVSSGPLFLTQQSPALTPQHPASMAVPTPPPASPALLLPQAPPPLHQTPGHTPTGSTLLLHAGVPACGVGPATPTTPASPPPPPPPAETRCWRALHTVDGRSALFSACELVLTGLAWLLVVALFPLSMLACVRVVQEYERAIIFRLGRLVPGGAQGPGLFFVLPCMDRFTCVDLRVVSFDVAPQEILTKDLVTISVDAVVYFRIFEPIISITNVENSGYSTRLLAATTLRTVLGQYSLADILSQREIIAQVMQGTLDDATDTWGVKVQRVEVKDVRLPQELQRAMAAEAEATREARAKVITAEGEMTASRALRDAADVMAESPSAMQLRYLQTLSNISAEKNSTVIFPVPVDILGGLLRSGPEERSQRRVSRSLAPERLTGQQPTSEQLTGQHSTAPITAGSAVPQSALTTASTSHMNPRVAII